MAHGRGSSPALGSPHHPVWLHSIQTSPSKASFGEKDLSVLPSLLASSSESCLFCLGQFTAYRFCLQCMRLTVVHDKQRSGDFRTARGDPDSFDLHSAKITMSASSCCRLDFCVLRLKSPLTGGVSRCQGIKYWILQIAALSDQKIQILILKFN